MQDGRGRRQLGQGQILEAGVLATPPPQRCCCVTAHFCKITTPLYSWTPEQGPEAQARTGLGARGTPLCPWMAVVSAGLGRGMDPRCHIDRAAEQLRGFRTLGHALIPRHA